MDGLPLIATDRLGATFACHDKARDRLRRTFLGCADALHRFIWVRVGGDQGLTDDVVQQTCCEAARSTRFPSDDGECQAWLFGIARNLIRKHWQRHKREALFSPERNARAAEALARNMEDSFPPVESITREESATQLLWAITTLPASDQGLIFDVYFGHRDRASIARELGTTMKSLEGKLYRIRHRLRQKLKGDEKGNFHDQ